jgi:hypothetical protein
MFGQEVVSRVRNYICQFKFLGHDHLVQPDSGDVMDPRDWPLDPVAAAAIVVRVIEALDESDEDQRDALLYDFVSAAWGSLWALDQ